MAVVSFFVPGIPAPGGSKTPWPIYRGKGAQKQFTGKVALVDAGGQRTKDWRQSVVAAAYAAMDADDIQPFTSPLRASFIFWMPRPANHHTGGKRERELKQDAPHWHASKPDLLKLARSTEDAMTGIVYVDDKLIVQYGALEKIYVFAGPTFEAANGAVGTITGCSITITELDK